MHEYNLTRATKSFRYLREHVDKGLDLLAGTKSDNYAIRAEVSFLKGILNDIDGVVFDANDALDKIEDELRGKKHDR